MAVHLRPTALLVDDDPLSQKAERSRLERVGYTVFAAGGLSEALAQARQTRPDVIYLHMLSATGNLPFIQALRADDACRHIPISITRSDSSRRHSDLKSVPRGNW